MYSCFIFLVEVIFVAFLCLPWSLWLLFTFCFPSFGNEPFLPRAHLFALNTELNSITEGWLDQLWTPLKREQKFCSRLFYETTFPPSCFPPQLKLFFPPIQLPQLHWSQILMKLRVEMSVKLQLNVESNSSQIPESMS